VARIAGGWRSGEHVVDVAGSAGQRGVHSGEWQFSQVVGKCAAAWLTTGVRKSV
jgi:hypothetical protein